MITGLWMDEGDGAMRLVIELDDGDRGLVEVDLRTDPVTTCDLDGFDPAQDKLPGWVEMAPRDPAAPDPQALATAARQLQVKLDLIRSLLDTVALPEVKVSDIRKVLDR